VLQGRDPAVPGGELPQRQVDGVLLRLRPGQPHGLGEGVVIDVYLRQRHDPPPAMLRLYIRIVSHQHWQHGGSFRLLPP
jgi:hypothetical protein